ncbi:MAG: hypothetical protein FWE51_00005, partial [Coriobacteriia bacterium]|nr:hypothetical protein [Coriobacteriia bacterium]
QTLSGKQKSWHRTSPSSEQKCNDIAWEEYLAIQDPTSEDGKWTLDMMEAEAGKYYNTIQLVAKVL